MKQKKNQDICPADVAGQKWSSLREKVDVVEVSCSIDLAPAGGVAGSRIRSESRLDPPHGVEG